VSAVGRIVAGIERTGQAFFGVIRIVMYAAPIGAFGAMAFTIGKYGLDTLTSLLQLILTFYLTATFFVVVILGLVARYAGVNIFKLLRYLKEELLIVLGTSSSESVLPQVMKKLEHLGVPQRHRVAGSAVDPDPETADEVLAEVDYRPAAGGGPDLLRRDLLVPDDARARVRYEPGLVEVPDRDTGPAVAWRDVAVPAGDVDAGVDGLPVVQIVRGRLRRTRLPGLIGHHDLTVSRRRS